MIEATQFQLKGTAGALVNQKFPVRGTTVIGSDPEANVVISGEGIEALHAVILAGDGAPSLSVKGSGIAVRLNGEEVSEASLSPGDEIQIAAYRFVVQAPGLRPEKVLTEEAVKPKKPIWPWFVAATALAGAAYAAWHFGLLDRFLA